MPVPTRSTTDQQLDAWNAQFRQSDVYLNFMRRNGLPTNGRVQLDDRQQAALEREMASAGVRVPSGMHIDQGGNLNQKNHLLRNVGIGAAIGGGALTGFGLAGMGPLAGLGGGAAASAGGATTMIPGTGIPVVAGAGPGLLAPTAAGIGGAAGAGAAGAAGAGTAGAGAAAAGGGSILSKVLTGIKDYGPLALAGAGAVKGMTQGPSDAEGQLANIIKMAEGRVQASEPLFQMLNQYAQAQMPNYVKGQG